MAERAEWVVGGLEPGHGSQTNAASEEQAKLDPGSTRPPPQKRLSIASFNLIGCHRHTDFVLYIRRTQYSRLDRALPPQFTSVLKLSHCIDASSTFKNLNAASDH